MFRRRGDTIVVRFLPSCAPPPTGGRGADRSLADTIRRGVELEAHRLGASQGD
jgi:hypothetical protein